MKWRERGERREVRVDEGAVPFYGSLDRAYAPAVA